LEYLGTPVGMANPYFFLVYQSPGTKKDWRWRFHAPDRKTLAVSGQGYADKADCINAIHVLAEKCQHAEIHDSAALFRQIRKPYEEPSSSATGR
jgi:uncharacterized protein YegP (UPF0339 family)